MGTHSLRGSRVASALRKILRILRTATIPWHLVLETRALSTRVIVGGRTMSTDAPAPIPLPLLATTLLHTATSGVLSTASVLHGGWPFGSLTPFALASDGSVTLVLSDLAEHTRNVRADPRASLFVQEPVASADPQSQTRLALLGSVRPVDPDALADTRARYVARHPEGERYLRDLDFRAYSLSIDHVRLIAGFGRIAWLEGRAIREDPAHDPLASAAPDILAHMNGDHADVLGLYCAAFRARAGVVGRMVAIDAWGFDVEDQATRERFRFPFPARVTTADAVRAHVVAMAREARARLGIAPRG